MRFARRVGDAAKEVAKILAGLDVDAILQQTVGAILKAVDCQEKTGGFGFIAEAAC